MKTEDIEKTALNTKYSILCVERSLPIGQFEYLVMPMVLCNAPATFQTLMNQLFYDCIDDFVVVYMDDLLISSKDEASHLKHLETVLRRREENKLFVSLEKCEFMKAEIDFLGFLVRKDEMRDNPSKVEVLKTWPKPKSLFEVRSFLGLLQFFRRFIPKFSEVAAPMTHLTKKDQGIEKWDEKCDEAFEKLKKAITNAPILVSLDWSKSFRCHIDASQTVVGRTLTQLDENGRDRVIAFYSKILSPTESVYTANDRKLLGLISLLNRFRRYLEGTTFEVFTDNQVLKSFVAKPKLSIKESKRLETLGNFGIIPITLKPGKIHFLRDLLSRATHVMEKIDDGLLCNDFVVPFVKHEEVITWYGENQFFGPAVKAIEEKWPQDQIQRRKLEKIFPIFRKDGERLY